MKKGSLFIFCAVLALTGLLFLQYGNTEDSEILELREKHAQFLKNKPGKANTKLSRKDLIKEGLPPNRYYELMEYLTMNPALGYPEPYKVRALQKELDAARKRKSFNKAPGEPDDNPWVERGPTNVGGRTRVLLFDPNDNSDNRVYAGAISGGLWVNEDITNQESPWDRVSGLPANMNISCITVDPRDSDIWYVGTGEQYTAGDVMGTGVYKTTDGGDSWSKVLDVEDFSTDSSAEGQRVVGGTHFINDITAWDNGEFTEIYIGVSTHIYANAGDITNFMGFFDRGLYRSLNGGDSWEINIEDDSFNDFETDAEGNLWVATTNSPGERNGRGGKIFRRNKGVDTNFSHVTTIPGVLRTEIEASAMNASKFYVLAEADNGETRMWSTTNSFENINSLPTPNDADNEIPPSDFARGQAFYNLMIESDPTDDNVLYAGGIDLFRSANAGENWEQISKWSNNNNLEELSVSIVHADQHVMKFRPGNTNQAIFGHDGGVSFARDLLAASNNDVFITPETDYITTQFYSIAVAPTSFRPGDFFLGGTQDNGSLLMQNGDPVSLGVLGGDGAHAFFDQIDTDYFIANIVYNNRILAYDYGQESYKLIADNEDNDGFFINPQALDSNLDKLFSNGPEGTLYRYDNIDGFPSGSNAPRESLMDNLLNSSISALTVSPYNANSSTVLTGLVNGRLLRVENAQGEPGEASWKNIAGSSFVGSISDVELGDSEEEILVTFYNYGVTSVWYTENGLDENPVWRNKEGNLPDFPVLAILKNPLNDDEVIIGTELGIWATQNFTDVSPSWNQAYNGMSDVKVTDLDLRRGDNMVFAASYGRGIFSGQFTPREGPGEEPGEGLSGPEVLVFPTVSEGHFRVGSAEDVGETRVKVYSLTGQQVHVSDYNLNAGIPLNLDLTHLSPGVYIVKTTTAEISKTQKLVIR